MRSTMNDAAKMHLEPGGSTMPGGISVEICPLLVFIGILNPSSLFWSFWSSLAIFPDFFGPFSPSWFLLAFVAFHGHFWIILTYPDLYGPYGPLSPLLGLFGLFGLFGAFLAFRDSWSVWSFYESWSTWPSSNNIGWHGLVDSSGRCGHFVPILAWPVWHDCTCPQHAFTPHYSKCRTFEYQLMTGPCKIHLLGN